MKKLLCMILALAMALSLAVPALADTYSDGTDVTYTAAGVVDPEDPDNPETPKDEFYYVDVPATLTVGGANGTVKVWGLWAASKTLSVTTASTVTLTISGGTETVDANVTFAGISQVGNSLAATTADAPAKSESISAAFADGDAPAAGTWSGEITYTVSLA